MQKRGVKILAIVLFLAFFALLVFILLKTFYLNRPKAAPDQTVISYLKLEQNSQRDLAEKYLFSDSDKVEILGEKYSSLRVSRWIQKPRKGKEAVFEIEEAKNGEKEALVKILEKTNKKQGWIFFNYYLPKEITFKAELIKIGSWKKGYQWKIVKLNSPDLVLKKKMGEKAEVKNGLFVKPIKVEKLGIEQEGWKIYSLDVEYENRAAASTFIYPFGNWRIVDSENAKIGPPSVTSALYLREPVLFGGKLNPGETKRGYVMFETEREISIKELIFKNMEKEIVFSKVPK